MTGHTPGRLAAFTCLALLLLANAAAGLDCSSAGTAPVTDFRFEVVPAETAPILVNFYSTSGEGGRNDNGSVVDPVESYSWDFGDGEKSEASHPVHTYAMSSARFEAPDKPFPVTLTVRTACGVSNSTTKNVSVYCLGQKAGFTISQPAGDGPYTAPVAVYIRDSSLHVPEEVTTWHYTLWDAGKTRLFKESAEKDPAFIVRNGGSYVLRQEIFKGCSNPAAADTVMEKTFVVTGSAATDANPMETIPFTPLVTETPVTLPPVPTTLPPATVRRTTVPEATPELPPAVSPPGTGTLVVNSTPAGAQVVVNEVVLGTSPATITGLVPGLYQIRLVRDGYRNATARVEIGDGRVTEYAATLDTGPGIPEIVPVLVAVIVIIAAGAGVVHWSRNRKKKEPPLPDWNNL